jgi:hypothetical protein
MKPSIIKILAQMIAFIIGILVVFKTGGELFRESPLVFFIMAIMIGIIFWIMTYSLMNTLDLEDKV